MLSLVPKETKISTRFQQHTQHHHPVEVMNKEAEIWWISMHCTMMLHKHCDQNNGKCTCKYRSQSTIAMVTMLHHTNTHIHAHAHTKSTVV